MQTNTNTTTELAVKPETERTKPQSTWTKQCTPNKYRQPTAPATNGAKTIKTNVNSVRKLGANSILIQKKKSIQRFGFHRRLFRNWATPQTTVKTLHLLWTRFVHAFRTAFSVSCLRKNWQLLLMSSLLILASSRAHSPFLHGCGTICISFLLL